MTLLLTGGGAGLAIGLAAWTIAGGASANEDKIVAASAELQQVRAPPQRPLGAGGVSLADLQAAPLFALTVGPGAVKEPAVRLDGISISGRRSAALLSIDGKSAEWLLAGETRDGVTVAQVRRAQVVIDTALGTREIGLGEGPGGSGAVEPSPAATDPDRTDGPPRGFRAPLPPAGAPR